MVPALLCRASTMGKTLFLKAQHGAAFPHPAQGILPFQKFQDVVTKDASRATLKRDGCRWPGVHQPSINLSQRQPQSTFKQQTVKPTKIKRSIRVQSKNYLIEPVRDHRCRA